MIRRESGFTLIELLITTLIFVIVLAGASQMFVGLLSGFKQQSKIVETNIEGMVGLDLLRRDMENAGYGLPWNSMVTYKEVENNAAGQDFNDSPTTSPPRAVAHGNNSEWHGTDRLVIKAVNVAMNSASEKWTFLQTDNTVYSWPTTTGISANPVNSDYVIVLSPGTTEATSRSLVTLTTTSTQFWDTYENAQTGTFTPDTVQARILYAVKPQSPSPDYPPKMPFNRADFYISGTADRPERCAVGTGVLEKAVASQKAGSSFSYYPLLDCVADMQVNFAADTNSDGQIEYLDTLNSIVDTNANGAADEIRNQLREIRVFILAQEGQKDRSYTHTKNVYHMGDPGIGRDFDLSANITDWEKYRWKVYTIVVKPNNLR